MNTIKGINNSETKMIKGIQKVLNIVEDGAIGAQTMTEIAVTLGAKCFPLTVKLFFTPVIIANDITICNPRAGTKNYVNSISGSFSYNSLPCSIMVNDGKEINSSACHAFLDKPESVLYRLKNGKFGITRCLYANQLPAGVDWAVGGLGLLDMYNPIAEGFSGKYADVLRKTDHTVLGIKNGMCYLVYCKAMTGIQVNSFCRDKLKLEMAVMLDGGHVASINGEESFARINTSQTQYYLIQGV